MLLPNFLLSLGFLSLASATAPPRRTSYTVHSRLIAPTQQDTPFRSSGTIQVDVDVTTFAIALDGNGEVILPRAKYVPLLGDLEDAQKEDGASVRMEDAWYQVAVEVEGTEQETWPKSVIRACHLPYANHSTLTVHINTHPPHPSFPPTTAGTSNTSGELESPHPSFQPYAITYRLAGIPHTNECRPETHGEKVPLTMRGGLGAERHQVDVVLKTRQAVHTPYLPTAVAPSSSPSGNPTTPPVEQSFLQKYWLYIVGAGMAVLLVGTQDQPAQG